MQTLEQNSAEAEVKQTEAGIGLKVVNKSKNLWTMIGGVIGIFLVLWCMYGCSSKVDKKHTETQTSVDDQSDLSQAQSKLNTAAPQKAAVESLKPLPLTPEQAVKLQDFNTTASSQNNAEAQNFQARMNQPSLLFGNGKSGGATAGQSTSGLSNGDGYSQFANSQSTVVATIPGQFLKHPDYTIVQGEVLHATLDMALNSDLPGMLNATLSSPVYAYTSDRVLLPKGSRLIGQYSTQMGNGLATDRIFIVWNRVVTPDGLSMMINSPSMDALGQAGVGADDIQRHLLAIFGGGVLYSILGGAAASVGVNGSTQNNSANQMQMQVAENFTQSAQQQLQSSQNIKSTLLKYQGSVVDVYVNHDVDLYSALSRGH